jgi:hypothetical protein
MICICGEEVAIMHSGCAALVPIVHQPVIIDKEVLFQIIDRCCDLYDSAATRAVGRNIMTEIELYLENSRR